MIMKQHCKNTGFDYRNFFIGKCHTPDGALLAIRGQKMHIESDLELSKCQAIDNEIKLLEANDILDNPESSKIDKLRANKAIIETNNAIKMFDRNIAGATQELANLTNLEAELLPLCKYAELDFIETQELIQRDEWAGELKARAENMMLSQMTGIPWDHMETMRAHPDFAEKILPHIIEFKSGLLQLGSNTPDKATRELTHLVEDKVKLLK